MSNETIRLLLRNLESTIHDRLVVIESLLQHTPPTRSEKDFEDRLSALEKSFNDLALGVMDIRYMNDNLANLSRELQSVKNLLDTRTVPNVSSAAANAVHTAGVAFDKINVSKEEEEKPVEAVEAEVEEVIAETEAMDASTIEEEAKRRLREVLKEMDEGSSEEEEEEVVEEEEEVVEEEEEEEVVEEEEEEVEEEALEVEDFMYRGRKYWKDSDNTVYLDEEGDVGDPVGKWDPTTKKIRQP